MIKVCEQCGCEFEAQSHLKKYCEPCAKRRKRDSDSKSMKYSRERNEIRSVIEKYEAYRNNELDKVMRVCRERGISYAQYQAMENQVIIVRKWGVCR